jgi:hypothetical protein
MLWRIAQSFLASATCALPIPERLAIAWAQSFNPEAFLTRERMTTAASYIRVRANVSPHRDIRPLRSTSPDLILRWRQPYVCTDRPRSGEAGWIFDRIHIDQHGDDPDTGYAQQESA